MSRQFFLSLPVNDLELSRAFFEGIGLELSGRGCEQGAACIVIDEATFVMLIEREKFAEFVTRPVADARIETAVAISIGADDREAVDEIADRALRTGATEAKETQEYGFMYNRCFHDPDGHLWEIVWMDSPPRAA